MLANWSTPILLGKITNKDAVDHTISHILENYDLVNPPSDLAGDNIFDDPGFDLFKTKIVIPAFNQWLKKTLNGKTLKDFDNPTFRGWLAGAHSGYQIKTHNHSGSQVGAVFYLLNDQTESGKIIFFDPRFNANRNYKTEMWGELFEPLTVDAVENTFVIFPSFVYHQTTNFTGNLRIAIPVDLFV
jgi:hypothetical protein